jgi:hypothetical protein
MANITYTYYVKYASTGYYVATYYLHQQPVYTKDANGNVLSYHSADSYGYDFVAWAGGTHLDTTYVSSLPSAYFDGATTYSGDQGSTISLTYSVNTVLLKNICGTFPPTERFTWAFGTVAPDFPVPTLFPTLEPLTSISDKSLDFAFNTISYASTHLQKHNDSKHATLTITGTNNIMFNGQFLGESIALPSYIESESGQYISKYDNEEIGTYVAAYLANNLNIHTFRSESIYKLDSYINNAYKSAFGIISHTTQRSSEKWTNSYAYIFNFGNGRLTTTIKDLRNNSIVGVNGAIFGGDRLKWDTSTNKYLLNQFDAISAENSFTDPIPTATSSKDGLFSKSSYSYVYSETGKLRTDVDALKKVTQAPCAYYVDFDTSPLFYRGASTGIKTTTYTHGNFWDQLLNVSEAVHHGLQIIGYSNKPSTTAARSFSYINISSAYFGCLFNGPTGDNSYCITTHYTYNFRVYCSYIYMSSSFYETGSKNLSYFMMAYVSPLNMQLITSSNEGTFTK